MSKKKIGFNVNTANDNKAYEEFQTQFNNLKNMLENLKNTNETNYAKAIDAIYEYLSNQGEQNADYTAIQLNTLECAGVIYNLKKLMKGRLDYFAIGTSVFYNTDYNQLSGENDESDDDNEMNDTEITPTNTEQ